MKDPRIIKFLARPFSWSSMSSFAYNREKWYEKYILGIKPEVDSSAMVFGKTVGERLASDPAYLPAVPRLKEYEHKILVKIGKILCVGFLDNFDLEGKCLTEFKTGKLWTQKKAESHGQIDLYVAMIYLKYNIKPEDLTIKLVWMSTEEQPDFSTGFTRNMKPVVFPLKKTMRDSLSMMVTVQKVHKEMQDYILSVPVDNSLAKP